MSTTHKARSRLIVALDTDSLSSALALARPLAPLVGLFKIGSQLFTAEGPRAVEKLACLGPGIFLDLKFHDIPNTVAGAVRATAGLPGVRLLNVHALGGYRMMAAAAEALSTLRKRPELLAVTILTSMDKREMARAGIRDVPRARVLKLAALARRAGLDGVVASPQEVTALRRMQGRRLTLVVPGIRPASASRDDQQRTTTPGEAIRAGADYIVVGRPITAARDPRAAAKAILAEMASALPGGPAH